MDVSILIVTRDRADDLRRCLASVTTCHSVDYEVVLVDNASCDPQIFDVVKETPRVRYFRLPKNYGDWEARDIGRLQCKAPFILSLDDDAELTEGSLLRLLQWADMLPQAAVIQPRVLEPRRSPGRILGPRHDPEVPHLLPGFLGGACLYRAKVLEDAGGFPHFHLGGAEPFLTYKFLDLGYQIVYVPDVTVVHWASPAGRIPWQRLYFSSAGRVRAVLRNEPRFLFRLGHLFWKPVALALACIERKYYLYAAVLPIPIFFLGIREIFNRPQCKVGTIKLINTLRRQMQPVTLHVLRNENHTARHQDRLEPRSAPTI